MLAAEMRTRLQALGIVAVALLGDGCAQVVGVEDWTPSPAGAGTSGASAAGGASATGTGGAVACATQASFGEGPSATFTQVTIDTHLSEEQQQSNYGARGK